MQAKCYLATCLMVQRHEQVVTSKNACHRENRVLAKRLLTAYPRPAECRRRTLLVHVRTLPHLSICAQSISEAGWLLFERGPLLPIQIHCHPALDENVECLQPVRLPSLSAMRVALLVRAGLQWQFTSCRGARMAPPGMLPVSHDHRFWKLSGSNAVKRKALEEARNSARKRGVQAACKFRARKMAPARPGYARAVSRLPMLLCSMCNYSTAMPLATMSEAARLGCRDGAVLVEFESEASSSSYAESSPSKALSEDHLVQPCDQKNAPAGAEPQALSKVQNSRLAVAEQQSPLKERAILVLPPEDATTSDLTCA